MKKQNKNTDKLTDKAFSRLMLSSVLGILVCIVCLCSATWAWFSTDISSDSNTLESGNFGLSVTVTDANDNPVTVSVGDNGTSVCTLGEAGLYTVTLKVTDDTTVSKGFCAINVNGKTYRTASINNVDGEKTFTFKLDAKADVAVSFASMWGIPAEPDVEIGETLTIASTEATTE